MKIGRMGTRTLAAALAAAAVLSSAAPSTPALAKTKARKLTATEKTVRKRLLAFKKKYPEGKKWGGKVYRAYGCGIYSGGYGCAVFAFELFAGAFGRKARGRLRKSGYLKARVGDVIRRGGHSMIVIGTKPNGGVEVAEGNYSGRVHWGRTVSKSELKKLSNLISAY